MITDAIAPTETSGLAPGDLVVDRALDDPEQDLLKHSALVGQVARLVREVDTSVNIALFGPWGSGKSSVGALLRTELAGEDPGGSRSVVRFVRYDAWRYAGVSLQRSFITEAAQELGLSEERYHRRLYQDRRTGGMAGRALLRVVPTAALTFLFVLAAAALVLGLVAGGVSVATDRDFLGEIEHQIPNLLPAAAVISLLTAVLRPMFDAGAFQVQEAAPTAAEQFRSTFADLIDDALRKARGRWWRSAWSRLGRPPLRRWSRPSAWRRKPYTDKDRIVFFIDELDRCSPEDVVDALRALKTFLDAKHCVFVVAADRDVIEAALDRLPQATPANEEQPYYSTAGAFLDKVFQYQISLPPLRGRRLTRFALDLVRGQGGLWRELREYEGGQALTEVVYALIPSHVRSPRRVKVLLNRFAANARIAEATGIRWRERAQEIAKLTVLETEFPSVAADLRLEPRLLSRLLDPPDRPSPLLSLLLQRHDLGVAGDGSGNGSRAPARLLAGERDPRLARTQRAELRRYLHRSASIRDPGRDLLFLETAGEAVGLEDAELADRIEELAPEQPGEVVASVGECAAAEKQKAVQMLADMTEAAVGSERRNVLTALLGIFELLEENDPEHAREIAWYAVTAVRIHRIDQALPPGVAVAALEATERSERRSAGSGLAEMDGGARDDGLLTLTAALLGNRELWNAADSIRRVTRLADHLELAAYQDRLACGYDRWPDALPQGVGRLTQLGVERLLALPKVAETVGRKLRERSTAPGAETGQALARRLYEAGGHRGREGPVSYTACPMLEHLPSRPAYRAVLAGTKRGVAPEPATPAAHNRLALLALPLAAPSDWAFWDGKLTVLEDPSAEDRARAIAALQVVFEKFPKAKPAAQDTAESLVRHLAAFAGDPAGDAVSPGIVSAVRSAIAPRWWLDEAMRAAHVRLHRAARGLRRTETSGADAAKSAPPHVQAVEEALADDLERAILEGAAAEAAVLDEIVTLAGQLPAVVSGRVLDRVATDETRAQWRQVGQWRDLLRQLGADEKTLEALYGRMGDESRPDRFERLATVFAAAEGRRQRTMTSDVEVAVRLASELGGAATLFAIGMLTSQASTAPAQVLQAYYRAVEKGAVAPQELHDAVLGATRSDEDAARGTPVSSGLRVALPDDLRAERLEADVVVIGSGAGGSVAAARLAARGRAVLVLERGPLVDPREARDNVLRRVAQDPLLAGGVSVFRAACVGGPTILSNGVASDVPGDVLMRWRTDVGPRFDERAVRLAGERFRKDMQLRPPRAGKRRGFEVHHVEDGPGLRVDASMRTRLSTVSTILPDAQRSAAQGAFEVAAECRVEQLMTDGSRVSALACRLGDGRELLVEPTTVVVAAGSIGSSALLRASGIGGEAAGVGIGFNLTALMLLEMPEDWHPERETRHLHLPVAGAMLDVRPAGADVVVAGLPSWFSEYAVGRSATSSFALGSLTFAASARGRLAENAAGRTAIEFELAADDRLRLRDGMKLAVEEAFAAGARRILPATRRPLELRSARDVEDLASLIADAGGLVATSDQPQGGNAMSAAEDEGVVDSQLRVHGFENLYVSDASVFPSPIGVYPQLTVMAMADVAARAIDKSSRFARDPSATPAPTRPRMP